MKNRNQCFINECRRAFFSRGMLAAILIGSGVSVSQVLTKGREAQQMLLENLQMESLYDCWIGGSPFGFSTELFYLLIPIIAALPYSVSYFQDKKTGYMQNVCIRTGRKKYLLAKFGAVFLSGGTAVVIPMLLNLFLNAMIIPAIKPEMSVNQSTIQAINLGGEIYFGHPLLYTLLYLFLDFIFAGLWATLSLAGTHLLDSIFFICLLPFIIYFSWNNLADFVGRIDWMTYYLFFPNSIHSFYAFAAMGGLLLGAAVLWGMILCKNRDVL